MLLKILLIGVLVAGAMAAVKDGRVLRSAGLLSSCTAVADQAGDQMQRCRKGKLDGYPDLSNKACQATAVRGGYEYWRCVAPIVASRAPRG